MNKDKEIKKVKMLHNSHNDWVEESKEKIEIRDPLF